LFLSTLRENPRIVPFEIPFHPDGIGGYPNGKIMLPFLKFYVSFSFTLKEEIDSVSTNVPKKKHFFSVLSAISFASSSFTGVRKSARVRILLPWAIIPLKFRKLHRLLRQKDGN